MPKVCDVLRGRAYFGGTKDLQQSIFGGIVGAQRSKLAGRSDDGRSYRASSTRISMQ